MDVDLVLFKKDGSQKTFSLRNENTVVGREDDCDLHVPLIAISRKHCRISSNNQTVKLQDLKSKNGTFLNGKRIQGEAAAKAGDYITIGPLTFLLQINGEPKEVTPPPPAKPKPKPAPKAQPKVKAPDQPQKKEPPKQEIKKEEPKKEEPIKEEPNKELELDDSFPDIDFDDSDPFADELEDV